jgi:putative FmdB family regulatory protein
VLIWINFVLEVFLPLPLGEGWGEGFRAVSFAPSLTPPKGRGRKRLRSLQQLVQTSNQFVACFETLIDKLKVVGHNICMPIYEFECTKCKAHTEVFQKMNDKQPTKCRKCGGRLERMVSASAIQFKGSGFYLTDYGRSGQKGAEKKESEATTGDDKKSDKADKKTKDGSPGKKTSEKASTKVSTSD